MWLTKCSAYEIIWLLHFLGFECFSFHFLVSLLMFILNSDRNVPLLMCFVLIEMMYIMLLELCCTLLRLAFNCRQDIFSVLDFRVVVELYLFLPIFGNWI